MTSIWKAIRLSRTNDRIPNSNSNFKHEKLFEEIPNDGSTFQSQYLGCIPVENPSGMAINSATIKRITSLARVQGNKNTKTVILSILPTKIIIQTIPNNNNKKNKKVQSNDNYIVPIEISLNRVSYCFVDSTYNRVIAFLATNDHGCHECHAFMTAKPKIAKIIALTISKAFINAYERWLQQKITSTSTLKSGENISNENNKQTTTTATTTTTTTTTASTSTTSTSQQAIHNKQSIDDDIIEPIINSNEPLTLINFNQLSLSQPVPSSSSSSSSTLISCSIKDENKSSRVSMVDKGNNNQYDGQHQNELLSLIDWFAA